jgi:hypothetical protein
MALSPEHAALLPLWNRRKQAQWERIAGAMPGLQLVTSKPRGSSFMLVCSEIAPEGGDTDQDGKPGFYEGIVIGRLPQVVYAHTKGRVGQIISTPLPEHLKPLKKRGVDLKDEEIDQVLACWKEGRSALDLPFVSAVWGRDGKIRT